MNIVADESVDGPVVAQLRRDRHRVDHVAEMSPGSSDNAVLDCANSQNAVLMTADKDFGELVFRLHRVSSGVILIRLSGLSAASKARMTSDALDAYGASMADAFTVICPGSVRIRHRA